MNKLLILPLFTAALLACSSGDDDGFSRGTPSVTQSAPPPATRVISGPIASIEPSRGRPGTEVIVNGSGWPAQATITISTLIMTPGASLPAYATVTADANGAFTARFRLDRTPMGEILRVGRFDLAARFGSTEVRLPFEVDPPLPGGGAGPGGG